MPNDFVNNEGIALHFRPRGDDVTYNRRYYANLCRKPEAELVELASEDPLALYVLGWRAAWKGDASRAISILQKVRERVHPEDRDIVDLKGQFWSAIAGRHLRDTWRSMRAVAKAAGTDRTLLTALGVMVRLARVKWPPIAYVAVGVLSALIAAVVLTGGWVFSVVLASMLVAYVGVTALALWRGSGDSRVFSKRSGAER